MKVKKVILFEQGAFPEPQWEDGKFVGNKILNYAFEPSYQEDFVYVQLYRYGVDCTVAYERVKVGGRFVRDSQFLMNHKDEDYDNIRAAISRFDGLLKSYSYEWEKAVGERSLREEDSF